MSDEWSARVRYHATDFVRLPFLLPGAVTAWEGRAARVVETRELDNGDIAVVLDIIGGKVRHIGGAPAAQLPVFTEPYAVCSCHGDPWPCNEAWAATCAKREEQRAKAANLRKCFACGQSRNLGRVRYLGADARRYCRRVACVREYERAVRDLHNERERERQERASFAALMTAALGDGAA